MMQLDFRNLILVNICFLTNVFWNIRKKLIYMYQDLANIRFNFIQIDSLNAIDTVLSVQVVAMTKLLYQLMVSLQCV